MSSGKRLKIAIYNRSSKPFSLQVYLENILNNIRCPNIEWEYVTSGKDVTSDIDMVWDPGLGMSRVPKVLQVTKKPTVVTVHGLKAFSVPMSMWAESTKEKIHLLWKKYMIRYDWARFKKKVKAVLTPSYYGKREIVRGLRVSEKKVHVVPHGVDKSTFNKNIDESRQSDRHEYFLHVSSYQPVKNIRRMVEGYQKSEVDTQLKVIGPNFPEDCFNVDGVDWVTKECSHEDLVSWYNGCKAFVFPSIRETFGMPVAEAMSCGAPIITSDGTGCKEVAKDAAILVNPYSVESIAAAFKEVEESSTIRNELAKKSMDRSKALRWSKSAKQHISLFKQTANIRQ
ncbi:glycosyltransferase family 4 protein [Salinibacter ruber]|uniref:glycosyltransferase family 4 protein n=1 Tax=Salinibacter ruber TaxID=146919 RepID=UPI00216711B7|nr:glycosyltransferase family 1 protein [Salinibacter ruber]MCS4054462.1 glycosyltransferase involved in cell wall biosynthesis [Salinibacter ruber]